MDEIPDVKRCTICFNDLPIQAFDPIKIEGKYVMKEMCRPCAKNREYAKMAKERRESNMLRSC